MSLFFQDDPLLTQRTNTTTHIYNNPPNQLMDNYTQYYKQQLLNELQQSPDPQPKDWLSELDAKLKGLSPEVREELNQNQEFVRLNQEVQGSVQEEIMNLVKYRLNHSEPIVNNVKKQIEIIDNVASQIQANERQNMMELNDYMKNYSHLTFNEYREMKNNPNNIYEEDSNKKNKKK